MSNAVRTATMRTQAPSGPLARYCVSLGGGPTSSFARSCWRPSSIRSPVRCSRDSQRGSAESSWLSKTRAASSLPRAAAAARYRSPASSSSAAGSTAAPSTNDRNEASVRLLTVGHCSCPRLKAAIKASSVTKRAVLARNDNLATHGVAMSSGCLHENEVLAFLDGALRGTGLDRVESHLDACLNCQLLVSAAVRSASLRTHGLGPEAFGRQHFEVGD